MNDNNKKRNILNISQSTNLAGGSDVYWYYLSKLLESYGHQVTSFASRMPGEINHPDNIASDSYHELPVSPSFESPKIGDLIKYVYSLDAKRSIAHVLEQQHFDLAHLHIYYGRLTGSILAELNKRDIPIVQTSHDFKIVCPTYLMKREGQLCTLCANGRFYNCLLHKCNRGSASRSLLSATESYVSKLLGAQRVDRVVAVSQFQKQLLVEMGIAENKITVVHNFVESDDEPPQPHRGFSIAYIGRLEEYKGVYVLLEALAQLSREGVEIDTYILGGGSELCNVKKFVNENQLSLVKVKGAVDRMEVKETLKCSTLLVAPSLAFETFGLTVVEAFASARPVIASNIGAYAEIVKPECNGFLTSPGNVTELRDAIRYFYDNPSKAEEMGLNGYKDARQCYDKNTHYRALMNVYNEVLT